MYKRIGAILIITFIIGCGSSVVNNLIYSPTTPPSPPSLEFFGYYGSATTWQDKNSPNVLKTLAPYSNLAWGFEDNVVMLLQVQAYRMQAIMDMQALLLPNLSEPYTDDEMRAIWSQTSHELEEFIADGTLLGVTVGDELYWNAELSGVSRPAIKSQMERAIAIIHELTPSLIVVVNEAEPEINERWEPPEGADWIGFDCYKSFSDCEVIQHLALIESRINKNQRIFLMPEAYLEEGQTEDLLRSDLNSYLHLAETDPRIVALIPFIFQCNSQFNGLSCLSPQTQRAFFRTGQAIKEQAQ